MPDDLLDLEDFYNDPLGLVRTDDPMTQEVNHEDSLDWLPCFDCGDTSMEIIQCGGCNHWFDELCLAAHHCCAS